MTVKDNDSNSWFIHCNQLLHKYNLLNIYSLKQHTNTKETQKEGVKNKMTLMPTSLGLKKGVANLTLLTLIYMTALSVGSTGVGNQLTTISVASIVL